MRLAFFDRNDICEAWYALESDYNVGGWLRERPSNQRRMEACSVQLHRMGWKPAFESLRGGYDSGVYDDLTDNAQDIYDNARQKLGLDAP